MWVLIWKKVFILKLHFGIIDWYWVISGYLSIYVICCVCVDHKVLPHLIDFWALQNGIRANQAQISRGSKIHLGSFSFSKVVKIVNMYRRVNFFSHSLSR